MRTVTFIPLALLPPVKSQPAASLFALGCVIEELSFISDYITNTNQTKELLSPLGEMWGAALVIRGSSGSPRMAAIWWLQMNALISVSGWKKEPLYSGPHARVHSQKPQVNWHTAIKMRQMLFFLVFSLLVVHEASLMWKLTRPVKWLSLSLAASTDARRRFSNCVSLATEAKILQDVRAGAAAWRRSTREPVIVALPANSASLWTWRAAAAQAQLN